MKILMILMTLKTCIGMEIPYCRKVVGMNVHQNVTIVTMGSCMVVDQSCHRQQSHCCRQHEGSAIL